MVQQLRGALVGHLQRQLDPGLLHVPLVTVTVTPASAASLRLPITIEAAEGTEAGDYRDGLATDTLSVPARASSASFSVTALADDDADDESLQLGFGDLPSGVGTGSQATATVTLRDDDLQPVGPVSVLFLEQNVDSVATYRATFQGSPVSPVRWTLTGPDAVRFGIGEAGTGADTLKFVRPPDYEAPSDGGSEAPDNVYDLTLQATDGTRSSIPWAVSVRVTDVNEDGTVTLRPDPPSVDRTVTAALADPDAGVRGLSWSWQRVDSPTRAVSTTAEYTPAATDVDYRFRVTARYTDAHGPDQSADTTSSPVQSFVTNRAPVISGSAADTVDENTTRVGTYTATDADGDAIGWSRTGPDSSAFTIGSSGVLRFGSAPNHESPTDADGDSVYSVEVVATDPESAADTLAVEVAVRNVNEPGTVTLSITHPKVGDPVTATLTDPDGGITGPTWTWDDVGVGARSRLTSTQSYRYTVPASTLGRILRASVGYSDVHGSGQSADTTANGPVQANVPGPPGQLRATAGSRQVALRWTAAAGRGAVITLYQYRRSTDDGRTWWSPDWTGIMASGAATTTYTETGLSSDTTYTFEVRARNRIGAGPASNRASARPRPPTCSLPLSGSASVTYPENGSGAVGTYTATASHCGSLSWSLAGPDASAFEELTGSGSSQELEFKAPPDFETKTSYQVTVGVSAGSTTASRAVTVTVSNVNEPGTVTLSSSRPYVGDRIWATLTDPDGGITGATWSWPAEAPGTRSAPTPTSVESYFYTVPSSAAGKILRASVSYSDVHGRQSADTTSTGTVRQRPCSLSLSASKSSPVDYPENSAGAVATYTATATNCGDLDWSPVGLEDAYVQLRGSGSSRDLHFLSPPNYETMRSYEVTVSVRSGSASASREVTVNVTDVNEPPVISGPSSPSVPENSTAVATYTATDPEGHTVRWTMATGGGTFSIGESSGALAFDSAKDYEALSRYTFTGTIRATDSGSPEASSTQAVTATVTNVDEPGTVTLSDSSPHVGDQLTATLTDPDQGIRQPTWSWTSGGTGARSSSVQSLRYTVPVGDFGKILKASVGYTDDHGPGKSASRTSSALVGAHRPDPPPDFDAARGDGQVVLTWGQADGNGAPITGYGYRYRSDTGSWPSRFTSISGRTVTISLTNGTLYHFQVQARSIGGASSSSEDSATPAGTPGAPQSLATDRQGGNGFMELTWEAAAANGSPILAYYYRYKKTGDEDWRGWYRRTGGANARSKSWTNFDDGSAYVFQVRARNGVDYGTTAQISASALGPGGSRGARGEHEETEDELMPEGEVPEPGEDDVVVFAKPVAEGPEASWLAGADSLAVRPGPNPFNPETTLRFQLPEAAPVTLTIHNTAGQRVVELVRGEILTAGLHERAWSGTDEAGRPVASGLYLYRLVAGKQVRVGKLALIR